MKIPAYKLVTSESAMNGGRLISLALPSRTIWAPFPCCPVLCARSSLFWLLCPLFPRPQHVVFQAQKVGTHRPTSCTHQPKPCFSTLPNSTSSRPPLRIQTWGRLTAPTPDTHGCALTLFLGKFPFLCAKACSTQATEPGGRLCGPDTVSF